MFRLVSTSPVVFVRNKKRNSRSTVDTRGTGGFPHVSIYNPTYDTDKSDKTFAVYENVNTIIYFRTIFLLRPGFHSLLDNHCRPIRYSPEYDPDSPDSGYPRFCVSKTGSPIPQFRSSKFVKKHCFGLDCESIFRTQPGGFAQVDFELGEKSELHELTATGRRPAYDPESKAMVDSSRIVVNKRPPRRVRRRNVETTIGRTRHSVHRAGK